MTDLDKPVTRKSHVMVRDGGDARPIVVTLRGALLTLRLLGRRQEETVSLEALYFSAVKSRVLREKQLKAKARIERKARR